MKKIIVIGLVLILGLSVALAAKETKTSFVLLIAEQNIEGPQRAWWASEIDLSTTETTIARRLIAQGYEVIEPSSLTRIIQQDKAFRMVNLSEEKSVKLGNLSKATYVILGKAIASSGSKVPQSSMNSCFGNITAKIIRVKDGKVIDYLDATGSSVHMDKITGGREALSNAADKIATKLINAITSQAETN